MTRRHHTIKTGTMLFLLALCTYTSNQHDCRLSNHRRQPSRPFDINIFMRMYYKQCMYSTPNFHRIFYVRLNIYSFYHRMVFAFCALSGILLRSLFASIYPYVCECVTVFDLSKNYIKIYRRSIIQQHSLHICYSSHNMRTKQFIR